MSFMNAGAASLMKEGATTVDEPVIRNISACREIAKITRSSMGPNGLCKMVINHMNKIFVTHDSSTILSELEVENPAAKLLVYAAEAMQQEVGDGTNLVVTLAGELLSQAENLVRIGLHPSDIIEGYKKASVQALKLLEGMVCGTVDDVLIKDSVIPPIRTAIASKQFGYEVFLANLVVDACINACPSNIQSFNVDKVRVVKVEGISVLSSFLVRGFVIPRSAEGTVKHVAGARIAVYSCAVDIPTTETKGNVLIENDEELMTYSSKEEALMEETIKKIAMSGANVVVSNSTFCDLALHYLNRYNIMALKIPSKFEMSRLCSAVDAHAMAKLDVPTPESLGRCDNVDIMEMGGKNIVVFAQTKEDSKLSTIVVRGATSNVLDDVERALYDGINVFKALTKDKRLVAGAGAIEMELQKSLMAFAERDPGLDQYAMRKFASSFEIVARSLAEVSGFSGTSVVTQLEADHHMGKKYHGVDVESGETIDAVARGIVDPFATKFWAIRLASDAAITVLQVDLIIVARQAGGPKPRGPGAPDQD